MKSTDQDDVTAKAREATAADLVANGLDRATAQAIRDAQSYFSGEIMPCLGSSSSSLDNEEPGDEPISFVVDEPRSFPPAANEVWSFECSASSLSDKASAARELGLVPVAQIFGSRVVLSLRRPS